MRKKVTVLIIPLILSLGASAKCLDLPGDTLLIQSSGTDSVTIISKTQAGTVVRVELKGAFGGSGFQWENLTKNCPVLAFLGTAVETDSSVIGAPQKLVYFYCVRGKKGTVQFDFALRRPWEKGKEPAQVFRHRLKVS